MLKKTIGLGLIAATLLLQACSMTPSRLPAVPHDSTAKAEIPGMPEVRYTVVVDAAALNRLAQQSIQRELDHLA
jgi:uncharacterized lipoprotein YajG